MKKDPVVFLSHIAESIANIEEYVRGVSREKFFASLQLQDSVVRRLEVIGEAVKNLPEDFKEKHPDVPWRKIAGMRDVLIHEYFAVDVELLWNLLEKDLKLFRDQIASLLDK